MEQELSGACKFLQCAVEDQMGFLFANFLNVECNQREGAPKAFSIVLRFIEFLVSVVEQFHGKVLLHRKIKIRVSNIRRGSPSS